MARKRTERGMNAALASGEAGVGEIKPARAPLKLRQLLAALLVAVLGISLGLMSYRAVASSPASFTGQVTPASTYYLNFASAGSIQTLNVRPGDRVKAGQVLATQDDSVAAAQVAAAQAAVKADAAIVAADQQPQATSAEAALDGLNVAKAQTAVSSAQGALSLAATNGQNLANVQQSVIASDQTTLNADNVRYAQTCTATASPSPSPSGSASPSPSPSASISVGQQQLCQSLLSQVERDTAGLAQAKADLTSIQSSNQAQQQQDASNVTASQSVLDAAQQLVASQGTALPAATIAQAQSQLATAQAQLAVDQLALKQSSIIAPADGTVAETAGSVGEIAGSDGVHNYTGPAGQAGTVANQQSGVQLFQNSGTTAGGSSQGSTYSALITVYSGALNVTAQLPESGMVGIHLGQTATVSITAANLVVTGRVSQIVMVPATVVGATYYDVTFAIESKSSAIIAGMSASVTLS
jgi:multidrug efflux pump subunit AcrA (membrane-fusion protein)